MRSGGAQSKSEGTGRRRERRRRRARNVVRAPADLSLHPDVDVIDQRLVEESIDGVFEVGPDGALRQVSAAGAALLGHVSPREALDSRAGTPLFDQGEDLPDLLGRVAKHGFVKDVRAKVRHKDGSPLSVLVTAVPVRNQRGSRMALRGTWRNVTGFAKLEEQYFHAQKMEAVGRLAGGVAHDFNNLLTVIQTATFFARREVPDDHTIQSSLLDIEEAAERAADLTRQLLAFSRGGVSEPYVLNLGQRVNRLRKMLRRLLPADVELVTFVPRKAATIRIDPGQLEQLIVNLVVNACDAMPNGGKLFLETAAVTLGQEDLPSSSEIPPGEYVMLVVCDTGSGMGEDVLQRIFEPYFTTKELGQGTGLGLATCYAIVRQSGGYIVVESERDRGSTFRVYFPRVFEPARDPAKAAPVQEGGGSETVLLVDDMPAVRRLAARALRTAGYRVLEACDAEEASSIVDGDAAIDILVTDVVMPGESGRTLADRLRQRLPELGVLFVSGYTGQLFLGDESAGAFLAKPFSPIALANKVREVLDSRATTKGDRNDAS